MTRGRVKQLRHYIVKASTSLTDEDALQAVELFPQWVVGHAYVVDERLQYNGVLYRVVQAHTSQADWTPDTASIKVVDADSVEVTPVAGKTNVFLLSDIGDKYGVNVEKEGYTGKHLTITNDKDQTLDIQLEETPQT